VQALFSRTTGQYNAALGFLSLRNLTTASLNTGVGAGALALNNGDENTASGAGALIDNTTGAQNTASGTFALLFNTTGSNNTAVGDRALQNNTTGGSNIAIGFQAGLNVTTGSNNIDINNTGVAGESNTIRIGGTQTKTFIAAFVGPPQESSMRCRSS
jgi:trimeric autotransporter adhesin